MTAGRITTPHGSQHHSRRATPWSALLVGAMALAIGAAACVAQPASRGAVEGAVGVPAATVAAPAATVADPAATVAAPAATAAPSVTENGSRAAASTPTPTRPVFRGPARMSGGTLRWHLAY